MAQLDERLGSPSPGGEGMTLEQALGTGQDLRAKREQLAQMQQQETASGFDVLKSPESLIKLALALGGGLSGNKDLQALGAGLGLGTLQAAPNVAQQAKIEHLDSMDKLIGQIEKDQQVMTQLLTQQPQMFVTPDGEDVIDPEDWRELMGLSVPLSPASILKARRLDTQQKQQLQVWADMITLSSETGNRPMLMQAITGMSTMLDLGITPEMAEGFIQAENFKSLYPTLMTVLDPMSVVQSLYNMTLNGGTIFDDKNNVLMARKKESNLDAVSDQKLILSMKAIELVNKAQAEMTPEQYAAMIEEKDGSLKFIMDVLSTEPVLKEAFLAVYGPAGRDDFLARMMLQSAMEIPKLMNQIGSFDLLPKMTDEERAKKLADLIYGAFSQGEAIRAGSDVENLGRRLANMSQAQRDKLNLHIMDGKIVTIKDMTDEEKEKVE